MSTKRPRVEPMAISRTAQNKSLVNVNLQQNMNEVMRSGPIDRDGDGGSERRASTDEIRSDSETWDSGCQRIRTRTEVDSAVNSKARRKRKTRLNEQMTDRHVHTVDFGACRRCHHKGVQHQHQHPRCLKGELLHRLSSPVTRFRYLSNAYP